jgi:hypothetical protein
LPINKTAGLMAGKFYLVEDFPSPDRQDYAPEKSVFRPDTGKSRFCGWG